MTPLRPSAAPREIACRKHRPTTAKRKRCRSRQDKTTSQQSTPPLAAGFPVFRAACCRMYIASCRDRPVPSSNCRSNSRLDDRRKYLLPDATEAAGDGKPAAARALFILAKSDTKQPQKHGVRTGLLAEARCKFGENASKVSPSRPACKRARRASGECLSSSSVQRLSPACPSSWLQPRPGPLRPRRPRPCRRLQSPLRLQRLPQRMVPTKTTSRPLRMSPAFGAPSSE